MEKSINTPTTPQFLKFFARKLPNIHIPQKGFGFFGFYGVFIRRPYCIEIVGIMNGKRNARNFLLPK